MLNIFTYKTHFDSTLYTSDRFKYICIAKEGLIQAK